MRNNFEHNNHHLIFLKQNIFSLILLCWIHVAYLNACLITVSNLSQGSVKEVSRGRSRHWQLMSRLQSSGSVRLASNVDLSPFSHVIWLNKQDWKCSNVAPVDHAPFQLQRASKQAVKRLMPTFQNHAYGCWRMKAAIHRILLPF